MFDIKDLKVERADQLEKLHTSSFTSGWSAADFHAYIKSGIDDVLGIEVENNLYGFVVTRTQQDQSEILTIVVSRDHRGQGVGKRLLAAAERTVKVRGAEIMFLEVAADNPSAQALYQSAGYQRCGTRKAYYRREKGRVDALLFQKHL